MASFQQAIQGKTREGGWDGHDNATLLLQDSQAEAIDAMFLAFQNSTRRSAPAPARTEYPVGFPANVYHPAARNTKSNYFLMDAATDQSMRYESLVKDVWLLSLFPNNTTSEQRLNWAKDNLTSDTLRLIIGVPGNANLPRNANVCVFNAMSSARTAEKLLINADTVAFRNSIKYAGLSSLTTTTVTATTTVEACGGALSCIDCNIQP